MRVSPPVISTVATVAAVGAVVAGVLFAPLVVAIGIGVVAGVGMWLLQVRQVPLTRGEKKSWSLVAVWKATRPDVFAQLRSVAETGSDLELREAVLAAEQDWHEVRQGRRWAGRIVRAGVNALDLPYLRHLIVRYPQTPPARSYEWVNLRRFTNRT